MMSHRSSAASRVLTRLALAATVVAFALVPGIAGAIDIPEITPIITFDPPIASFSGGVGLAPPANQQITVSITGIPAPYTAAWELTDIPPWLAISPHAGTAPGTTTMTFSVDTSGLAPGSYETSVPVKVTPNIPGGLVTALYTPAAYMPVKLVLRTGTVVSGFSVSPAQPARTSAALPKTTLSGKIALATSGKGIGDVPVQIWGSYDNSTWSQIATVTADSNGAFSKALYPTKKMYFKARYAGNATYTSCASAAKVCAPYAFLSTPGAPSAVKRNTSATFTGYVYPAHSSTYPVKLYFYRWESKNGTLQWVYKKYANGVKVSSAANGAYTGYKAMTSLPYTGYWKVRAVHADADHMTSYSAYRQFSVTP